ncbi:MAG TPA: M56 family metallopeptidase [Allosphingosinicella sp.]|jgi:beta-lactamase regulating signal transducer with metallopeptidase domain
MTYDFLIEMGWKSAAIAGGALLLAALLRSRAAADRGAVLKVAVALLLALPAIALFAPALEIETAAPAPVASAAALPLSAEEVAAAPLADSSESVSTAGNWDDPSLLFFLLYAGGVAMVGGRLLAGLVTLRRWTRAAREVESPEWRAALARAGGDALGIRLLASEDASSPLSWGLARPVILLDRDTLAAPDQADAILVHEVAHVARRDWPSLILSRLAVALFWFNPLVWRLDREVAQQAEEAADSDAAAAVEPARYAQTLLDWARLSGANALPANAIAAGEPGLSKRVKAILDGRVARRSGSFWAVAAMLGCAAFAAPVAAIDFVEAAPEAPAAPSAPFAPAVPPVPLAAAAPLAPAAALAPIAASFVPPAPAAAPLAAPAPLAPLAAMAVRPPRPPAMPHPAALARANAYARAAAHPHVDGAAIEAEVAAAVAQATRGIEAQTAEIGRTVERALADARVGMINGARGMESGAVGMERGAANMRAEARRLRDRAYRDEKIREHAARGKRLSHEDLIEAADDMEQGAEDMREGAREMREAAKEMREARHD